MLAPVGDHQEASCAVWAVMRVLARVDADLVALHVAQVAEAQWTVRALVWLLPRMAPQMHRQCRVVHKTLPTLWAHVRLVTDMGAKVYLQVAGASEAQPTHIAHVWPLPRVGAHVGSQVSNVLIALVALRAHVAAGAVPVPRQVCRLQVALQELLARKGLSTGWACVRVLFSACIIVSILVMQAQVNAEVLLSGKAFPTGRAAVWPLSCVNWQVLSHGGCIVARVRTQRALQW